MITTSKQKHTVSKRRGTKARDHAKKVGGIWLDPMSFPTLTEYDQENI